MGYAIAAGSIGLSWPHERRVLSTKECGAPRERSAALAQGNAYWKL